MSKKKQEEYGGYSTIETWAMARWILTNDKLKELSQKQAQESSPSQLSKDLEHFIKAIKPIEAVGPFREFIDYGLSKVNWLEIAKKIYSMNYQEYRSKEQ